MKRTEFSAKVRKEAYARSKGFCENKACGCQLQTGKFHYDHIIPSRLGGEASVVNCQVICVSCHSEKTAKDVKKMAKAERQHRKHIGAETPKQKLQSQGFPKRDKVMKIDKTTLPTLPRRDLYQ